MISTILADIFDQAGKVGPQISIGALVIALFRLLWTANINGQRIEARLRKEWTDDRVAREAEWSRERDNMKLFYEAALERQRVEYDDALARMAKIHDTEVHSLLRRTKLLEDEIASMKAKNGI